MYELSILLISLATAVIIAVLSLARSDQPVIKRVPGWLQPAGHFAAYALLAFLCTQWLGFLVDSTLWQVTGAFALATSFGVAMEFLQRFRIGRRPRATDALINAAGAMLGCVSALIEF